MSNYNSENNQLEPVRKMIKKFSVDEFGALSDDAQDYELQPNDQIGVRTNPEFEAVRSIMLTGEVRYPGTYTLNSKLETLAELIERAGGVTSYGDASLASMNRMVKVPENIKSDIEFYDDDEEIINGFFSEGEFVQIRPIDDEVKVKGIEVEKIYINKYFPLVVNLKRAQKNYNSKYNIILNDLDSINIPKLNNTVLLTGALSNLEDKTLSVPFLKKRANYYINNFAGGFSKHNVKSSTFVITSSGKVKKSKDFGLFVLHPRVENGSTIKVTQDIKIKREKSKPIDWTRVIEGTVTKLSAIASLYILYLSSQ